MAAQVKNEFESGRKRSWKRVVLFLVFIAINAIVIIATAVNEFGNSGNAAELSEVKINAWMLLPAVGLFLLANTVNVYKYVLMMKKSYPKQPPRRELWKIAWRVVMLGKYYDNVTPASIGGQPFQIWYMRKHSNLPKGHATAMPLVAMVCGQVGFLIVALVAFTIFAAAGESLVLMVTAWLGLLFFAFWPVMMAGINFFPKQTMAFLKAVVRLFAKLRIVKNSDKVFEKIDQELGEYVRSVKMIAKTRHLLAKLILLAIIYNILWFMMPWFILEAFGGNVGFLRCFVTSLAVTSAVYFVPTPGNSGAAEGTFYVVFSALSDGYIFWAMLVWRLFSYYIFILLGPVTYFVMKLEEKHQTKNLESGAGGEQKITKRESKGAKKK